MKYIFLCKPCQIYINQGEWISQISESIIDQF